MIRQILPLWYWLNPSTNTAFWVIPRSRKSRYFWLSQTINDTFPNQHFINGTPPERLWNQTSKSEKKIKCHSDNRKHAEKKSTKAFILSPLPRVLQHLGSVRTADRFVLPRLQGVGDSWRILPVKRRLLSTVKRILQLLDKVSLPRQPKKAFFFQPPLPDKIHTLLHQHRSQAVPISLFVSDSVF